MNAIVLRNRQRTRPVEPRAFRRLVHLLVDRLCGRAGSTLSVQLVGPRQITRLNEAFLGHAGSTDVITFDHTCPPVSRSARGEPLPQQSADWPPAPSMPLRPALGHRPPLQQGVHGEVHICVAEAVTQAPRFHTTWQAELARYLIHGLLHLQGYDDDTPAARRRMRRREDRLLHHVALHLDLRQLGRGSPPHRRRPRRGGQAHVPPFG